MSNITTLVLVTQDFVLAILQSLKRQEECVYNSEKIVAVVRSK